MRTYKKRQKIWVKARYEADAKDDDTECHVTINEDGDWIDAYDWRVRLADIRPRVKRKNPGSPWQPIEGAPKDGTLVLLRWDDDSDTALSARYDDAGECWRWWRRSATDPRCHLEPSHYMLIPKLEVE